VLEGGASASSVLLRLPWHPECAAIEEREPSQSLVSRAGSNVVFTPEGLAVTVSAEAEEMGEDARDDSYMVSVDRGN
jgi:hypothetical protein